MKKYSTWTQEQYEIFIKRWQQAKTVQEVASNTGLTVNQVNTRATHLRKKGVQLKKMKHKSKLNYLELSKIAEDLS